MVATFAVCGAVHDLVTTLVRGSPAVVFTPWFVCLAVGALAGSAGRMNLEKLPWSFRAAINSGYLLVCPPASLGLRRLFDLPSSLVQHALESAFASGLLMAKCNPDERTFKYVMIARPDDSRTELCECPEP